MNLLVWKESDFSNESIRIEEQAQGFFSSHEYVFLAFFDLNSI